MSIAIFIFGFALQCVTQITLDINTQLGHRIYEWFLLINMNNLIQVTATIVMFMFFKDVHIKSNKVVNTIAKTTLIIYLVHDHPDMRSYLWKELFNNVAYSTSNYLIPYSIAIITLVFIVCSAIGFVYDYSIGYLANKALSWLENRYLYKIDNIFSKPKEESNNNDVQLMQS